MAFDRGATLVEVLVVMAILGLTASVAGADWVRWSERRQFSDSIAKTIRLFDRARRMAQDERTPVSVAIDAPSRRLALAADSRSITFPVGYTMEAETAALSGQTRILFLPDGSSTGARIELSGGGQTATVEVSWLSGLAVDARR